MREVRSVLAKGISNVLVIEDCKDTAKLIMDTIEDCGVKPVRARDGAAALELLSKQKFSALILDLMTPEMDGFSFLKGNCSRGIIEKWDKSTKPKRFCSFL